MHPQNADLKTLCKEFLESKKISFDLDSNNDASYIRFTDKISGNDTILVFAINEGDDDAYIRIVATGLDKIKVDQESLKKLIDSTSKYKAGKAILLEDDLLLSVECFVYSTENVQQLYDRMYIVLRQMCEEYYLIRDMIRKTNN